MLALASAALAFTAALRFAGDTPEETVSDAPPSGEQTAEPPSQTTPSGISEEAVQDAPKPTPPKTMQEDRDRDLERWVRLMRTQLELQGIKGEELERQLEQRRSELAVMDASEREEHVINSGFRTVKWNPKYSDQKNLIRQKLFELTGSTRYPGSSEITPPEIIAILVEGLDDLAAAQKLLYPGQWRSELGYANIYVDRALAKDPDSRDALVLKARLAHNTRLGRKAGSERIYSRDAARRLFELYPDDIEAVRNAGNALFYDYPEDAIELLEPIAPKKGYNWAHAKLALAYERLDMISIANDHYELLEPGPHTVRFLVTPESRRVPSIWEERAAAAAEAAQQAPPPTEFPAPGFESPPDPRDFEPPPPHDHPDAPRPEGAPPPPPPNAEMDMAAAYADFAKAYQSMFEMEYGLSEATPEGYMNALLGMARAFAKSGDAQHAQDAYNAVRKRHSREEVEQVFRRFDEQERLKRQPPNDEENGGSGEDDEDE